MFSNLCVHELKDADENVLPTEQCEGFQEGIMKQGLYTATIKYWDYLRGLHNEFFSSNRDKAAQKAFFDDDGYKEIKAYQLALSKAADTLLISRLHMDIDGL